ncbi:N-acetylmuramoyl-L-alanine amidase [Virgibacillus natechei]|uniref:N-acetylmuramoyl-L-alanine amidase n=1 Tax=Virgibacillus natechei TaxID=1216297 RepID=A0ABS4IJ94_9BACI|nr:N-acetylmuramoyl-L-alanine amidase [Virgibacillus natechei]MBP1970980.1 N-acetylmuramoyl-L-alanine amidase [Virgibacillus natechei]UZD12748.1 N-acetylmuramoyl-L-alanine amidase [Virgibacillus natechei]
MKFIRYFTVGIGFLLFLVLYFPTTGLAENGDTYEVGNDLLNVRSEPAAGSEIIGTLREGDQIVAFQEKFGWIQTYYGGEVVWIAKHHLIPVSSSGQNSNATAEAEVTSEMITVTAESVNIRSGPGKNYSRIGSTVAGDTYNVIETAGDWHNVSLSNGSTGWVATWLTNSGEAASEPTNTSSNNDSNETAQQKTSSNGSLEGYTIVLDPGHGGNDPGAIGLNNVYEKDLTMSTTEKVEQQLLDAGADVTLTRTGDSFISLDERAHISNQTNTDAFISLHYDAFPIMSVNGVSTYFQSNGADYTLAQELHTSLASATQLQDRGVMEGNYRVLRHNNAPSVVMELGFITNQRDLATVQTADYQNQVAQAIKAGLNNYFNN